MITLPPFNVYHVIPYRLYTLYVVATNYANFIKFNSVAI